MAAASSSSVHIWEESVFIFPTALGSWQSAKPVRVPSPLLLSPAQLLTHHSSLGSPQLACPSTRVPNWMQCSSSILMSKSRGEQSGQEIQWELVFIPAGAKWMTCWMWGPSGLPAPQVKKCYSHTCIGHFCARCRTWHSFPSSFLWWFLWPPHQPLVLYCCPLQTP